MLAMTPVSLLPPPSISTVAPTLKPTVESTSNSVAPAECADVNVVDTGACFLHHIQRALYETSVTVGSTS
jgi:hypothetical protein